MTKPEGFELVVILHGHDVSLIHITVLDDKFYAILSGGFREEISESEFLELAQLLENHIKSGNYH